MTISTNAQRITRIYRGPIKVWEDPHLVEWQDIVWQERGGKTQVTNKFMAVNGIVVFDGSMGNGLDGNVLTVYNQSSIKINAIMLSYTNISKERSIHVTILCSTR